MDPSMKEFQQALIEVETEAEHLLLARHQVKKFSIPFILIDRIYQNTYNLIVFYFDSLWKMIGLGMVIGKL